MYKKMVNYVGKHPELNAIMHACGGIGLGLLIAYFLHPANLLTWAAVFIALAILGHLYVFFKAR